MEYLNKPIPKSESEYTTVRTSWKGLNRLYPLDSGFLTSVNNISVSSIPYLETAPKAEVIAHGYTNPISIHGFGDFLLVIYKDSGSIKADYIKGNSVFTGTVNTSDANTAPRSAIQFNVYTTPNNPLDGIYDKRLIIYPDKVSMSYDISSDFNVSAIDVSPNITPDIKQACVYLSRVFGVDDNRIYASGFNDYTNWNLDTADESLASNAWVSTAQSNIKAGSDFTGITVYGGTVVAFKRGFMHEIYNNKNPFRVGDIYAEGAIDGRSIVDVDGNLIFVGADNVKRYNGGNPENIGAPLCIPNYTSGIAGGDSRTYYLYCHENGSDRIFTYDVINGMWCARDADSAVIGFATNDNGVYTLCSDGNVRKIDTTNYQHDWYIETDLSLYSTLEPKRLKKLSLLAEIASGSNVKAYALKENEIFNMNTSQLLFDSGTKMGRVPLRCMIRQTAAWSHKIRICGTGYAKLMNMELRYSKGGDSYE